jgi:hypothetical protein
VALRVLRVAAPFLDQGMVIGFLYACDQNNQFALWER